MNTFELSIGPVQYFWPRERLLHFYADVAESAASTVVLGETVCARRHEMKLPDWLDLASDLAAAGKEVLIATQALIESEADLRLLRRIAEQAAFGIEVGDASAVNVLEQSGRPFVLGPHINVYSHAALQEYQAMGATRWVAPVELALEAVGKVNPPGRPLMPTEVFAHGRMPLAFSARCFTARHHRLSKDQCEFRCRDDADGLLLSTGEGEPFLVLNGIQTQSAATQCLLGERERLSRAGVSRLRLSPASQGMSRVIEAFDAVMNRGEAAAPWLGELQAQALPGGLANGFAYGVPGLEWRAA